MTTRIFPKLPGCGRVASARVELYSPANGRAHGSLDGAAYACAEHLGEVRAAIVAAGFTSYTTTLPAGDKARCGGGVDYAGPSGTRFIDAPTPLMAADDLAPGDVVADVLGEGHEFDHFEDSPAPLFNPDPGRAIASRVAVFRDGWRITIGSPRVLVLARGGAR